MTFMSSLASNPSSGVYGQTKQTSDQDVLGIVNQLKDREMHDFKDKANFMSDLSLKQDRMRQLYNPDDWKATAEAGITGQQPQQRLQSNQQMNTVMAKNSNEMTGYEKGELGIRQQGINLESQKIKQSAKQGEEALGIKTSQEKLNQEKSDQIHEQKMADMQRKTEEANQKIQLAQQALTNKTNTVEQTLQAHKDMAAAVEERHKLEIAQKDAQFQKTSDQHQQTIDNLTEQIKQRGRSKTTVTDSTGASRTTINEKGDAADTVNVMGKDGKTYTIPKDKLDDKDADGTPHWKQQGGE